MNHHRLTDFEQRLLDALLAGDDLEGLRDQVATASVGARRPASPQLGMVVPIHVPGAQSRVKGRSFRLDDVGFQLVGAEQEGRAELTIVGGRLAELEVYNLNDDWPADPRLVRTFYLVTSADGEERVSDQRDMGALKGKIALRGQVP